ncbi:MAG: BON domain-containing protein [Promethearchaeia archaeon]
MVRTDEDIKKDVVDQLYWDPRVDATDVNIDVNDGKVMLTGTVPDYTAKGACSSDAWVVDGVSTVKNEVIVEFPETFAIPTDEEIRSDIESSLSLNYGIDDSDVDITVVDGLVTLKGTVPTYWEKMKAEDIASGISGVVNVVNKLGVVPTEDIADQIIAEDVISAIARNVNVSVEDIDVEVNDGVVTLSGTVDDWVAYDAAMDAALYTTGVKDVVDNILIE